MSHAVAIDPKLERTERFELLLDRARRESEAESPAALDTALATYWEARNVAKPLGPVRCGEADLGIGVTLVDLGRRNEGLEAIRRACRFFAEDGDLFLRGCAHVALAEVALADGTVREAIRHLSMAEDLFRATDQELMAVRAAKLREAAETRLDEAADAAVLREQVSRLLRAETSAA